MSKPKRWSELQPDPRMVTALDEADAPESRARVLLRTRAAKNRWSNRFADACARMIAAELSRHLKHKKLVVRPNPDGPAEPLTFVAGGRRKKVDVIVSSVVSGLQIGISLKGMNFRDSKGGQFDKNLTGRTYELQDEVSVIHRYQPAAFLAAVYFLPIASTEDKRSKNSPSSFARAVTHLRARTGRLDPTLPSQMDRVDFAAVALYVPGDKEARNDWRYEDDLPRGVARYMDVGVDPPLRRRPRLETTMSLDELVTEVIKRAMPDDAPIRWAEPEA